MGDKFILSEHLGKRVKVLLDNHRYKNNARRWIVWTHEEVDSKKQWLNGKRNTDAMDMTTELALVDCEFEVVHRIRDRILRDWEKRKLAAPASERHKVKLKKAEHAWVIGTIVEPDTISRTCTVEVVYSPKNGHPSYIVVESGFPMFKSEMALFTRRDGRLRVFVPPLPDDPDRRS